MLKEQITYENFDGESITEVLRFNLTRTELADNLHLKDRFEQLEKTLQGERRELTTAEITEILDLVKTIMRLSYGVLSDDGRRFIKGERQWEEFTQTAAYDAFLFSLFENPEKGTEFLIGVLPKELRDEAVKVAEQTIKGSPERGAQVQAEPIERPVEDVKLPENDTLPLPKEKRPQDMTRDELLEAYKKKVQRED